MNSNDKGPKDKQKIIPFPFLKDRLMELGLEHLHHHRYAEAVNLLRQANEMDPSNQEISTAYLLALYENGDFEEAKELCLKLLHQGIGDYFEINDVYIMILIQMGDHHAVVHTIKALIDEKEVPFDKLDHYEKLLQFSQTRMDNPFESRKRVDHEPLFSSNDMKENMFKIAQLANQNIYPYIDELLEHLQNEREHPFIQTMILNVLREHHFNRQVMVKKFHYDGEVTPDQIEPVFETPFYLELTNFLKEKIEHENPTLFSQMKEILDRHFFLLYPFELSPKNKELWAAALYGYVGKLYGDNIDIDKIANKFETDAESLANSIDFIERLEEISLPIL